MGPNTRVLLNKLNVVSAKECHQNRFFIYYSFLLDLLVNLVTLTCALQSDLLIVWIQAILVRVEQCKQFINCLHDLLTRLLNYKLRCDSVFRTDLQGLARKSFVKFWFGCLLLWNRLVAFRDKLLVRWLHLFVVCVTLIVTASTRLVALLIIRKLSWVRNSYRNAVFSHF